MIYLVQLLLRNIVTENESTFIVFFLKLFLSLWAEFPQLDLTFLRGPDDDASSVLGAILPSQPPNAAGAIRAAPSVGEEVSWCLPREEEEEARRGGCSGDQQVSEVE